MSKIKIFIGEDMNWYIIVLECSPEYDPNTYYGGTYKEQADNKESAIVLLKDKFKAKGMSEDSWTKEFEIVEIFNCGINEPVSE